jgi:hypothetical protein
MGRFWWMMGRKERKERNFREERKERRKTDMEF